jgi:hypothetical protein
VQSLVVLAGEMRWRDAPSALRRSQHRAPAAITRSVSSEPVHANRGVSVVKGAVSLALWASIALRVCPTKVAHAPQSVGAAAQGRSG